MKQKSIHGLWFVHFEPQLSETMKLNLFEYLPAGVDRNG
jgi:hypothetical protein